MTPELAQALDQLAEAVATAVQGPRGDATVIRAAVKTCVAYACSRGFNPNTPRDAPLLLAALDYVAAHKAPLA